MPTVACRSMVQSKARANITGPWRSCDVVLRSHWSANSCCSHHNVFPRTYQWFYLHLFLLLKPTTRPSGQQHCACPPSSLSFRRFGLYVRQGLAGMVSGGLLYPQLREVGEKYQACCRVAVWQSATRPYNNCWACRHQGTVVQVLMARKEDS